MYDAPNILVRSPKKRKAMRLRVKIRNSKDCRTELSFPDLSVKYNNGYSTPLKLKEGEEIPLDLLDADDIKKSLRVGSLKGYSDNGWLEEITAVNEIVSTEQPTRLSHFITEKMISAPEMIAPLKRLEPVAPVAKQEDVPPTPILPEVKEVDKSQISIPKTEPITDLALVKTYEDFNTLSHFLKLQFIKDSNDMTLLKEILGKTPSVQFKNNINLRFTQLK